jgi:hypothetical protein
MSISIVITAADYEKIFSLDPNRAAGVFNKHIDNGLEDWIQEVVGGYLPHLILEFHMKYVPVTSEQKEV